MENKTQKKWNQKILTKYQPKGGKSLVELKASNTHILHHLFFPLP